MSHKKIPHGPEEYISMQDKDWRCVRPDDRVREYQGYPADEELTHKVLLMKSSHKVQRARVVNANQPTLEDVYDVSGKFKNKKLRCGWTWRAIF